MQATLNALRDKLAALENRDSQGTGKTFALGLDELDGRLGGGLARNGLHEIFAAGIADSAAAAGFTLALARRAAENGHIVWARQAYAGIETGRLYAPGLLGLGFDPERVILVEVPDALAVLKAGLEAARCSALGGVIIEPWGEPKALDFTATRRLALTASQSEVPLFLLRIGAAPQHSAAQTRWQAAAGPSMPRAANAPGNPAFAITLLRHRAGTAGQNWHLEWDHEHRVFRKPAPAAPLSRPVVSPPHGRPLPAPAGASRGNFALVRA